MNCLPLSLQWIGDTTGLLRLLDQTKLPDQITFLDCRDVASVWEAIRMLRVRGAPAIGVAAAYAVILAHPDEQQIDTCRRQYLQAIEYLSTSRPTAINLFWALDRMRLVVGQPHRSPIELKQALLQQAKAIHEEDRQMCRQIGMHGSQLIADGAKVITHCNAGGLATSEYGTALAVLYTCQDQGKHIQVYADETRPLWQGARLTAWELTQRGIETTIICDSMAAHLMQTQQIDAVIVGADRITSRGDTANKIGTYALAIAAKFHHVPFYVAAPSSTFDFSLVEGQQIPIEQRSADEVTRPNGMTIGPAQAAVFNPAFDITPAELITAIVTEKGIIQPVDSRNIALILKSGISS